MKKKDINTFIEEMEEIGDEWTLNRLRTYTAIPLWKKHLLTVRQQLEPSSISSKK